MSLLVQRRIKSAVDRLFYFDRDLFIYNSSERSITHRFALYLGYMFYQWDIDVEYNRVGNDPKKIDRINQSLKEDVNNTDDIFSGRMTIYPDIIVHKRGKPKNHLVIEVKKINSTNDVLDQYDIKKLRNSILEPTLNYKYGAFVKLGLINEEPIHEIKIFTKEDFSGSN
ncbi:hypothetical protein K0T92_13055 [Paenibacillus oenotherae]|uniref:PD-(D/E)XK nuclease superfamily protein n=1 Tax=Paenibacillus oenotherae TaxID=1435645 RepID=A0ABS7D704_9BACL|nr:hypothetical protein [Paenibacillus oenotherae]MBW7475675.1 hypothetical protein [Paenibacillus oenotherae]